jgi:hypothetical protein
MGYASNAAVPAKRERRTKSKPAGKLESRAPFSARRKRAFLTKLQENLADNDPSQEDRRVDEFSDLILGR